MEISVKLFYLQEFPVPDSTLSKAFTAVIGAIDTDQVTSFNIQPHSWVT